MHETVTYYLVLKDVMRGRVFSISFTSKKALIERYKHYKQDDDYEVLSAHSIQLTTSVLDLDNELGNANSIESHQNTDM